MVTLFLMSIMNISFKQINISDKNDVKCFLLKCEYLPNNNNINVASLYK